MSNKIQTSHKCKWEKIDADVAGCVICGKIHACSDGECDEIQNVSDGCICLVTNVYIKSQNLVCDDYSDNIMRYDNKITFVEKPFLRIDHPMDEFVYDLLLSDLTNTSIMAELKRIKSRTQLKVISLLTKNRNQNFITIFEEATKSLKFTRIPSHKFDVKIRYKTFLFCRNVVKNIVTVLIREFPKVFRLHDLRNTVFGVMYLMRSGVVMCNKTYIPKIDFLRAMLPCESSLNAFKFKSTNITDQENKIKFSLRNLNPKQINFYKNIC